MNASLNDILFNIKKQQKNLNPTDLFDKWKKIHTVLQKDYEFIPPSNVLFDLELGDMIRISKNIDEEISGVCIVMHIEHKNSAVYDVDNRPIINPKTNEQYINRKSAYVSYINLTVRKDGSPLKISPDGFFIFRHISRAPASAAKREIQNGIMEMAKIDPTKLKNAFYVDIHYDNINTPKSRNNAKKNIIVDTNVPDCVKNADRIINGFQKNKKRKDNT
jgi:hypothetical protein